MEWTLALAPQNCYFSLVGIFLPFLFVGVHLFHSVFSVSLSLSVYHMSRRQGNGRPRADLRPFPLLAALVRGAQLRCAHDNNNNTVLYFSRWDRQNVCVKHMEFLLAPQTVFSVVFICSQ